MNPAFPSLQNDLLLRTLAGQTVERPPVWMMRQAGRYLPDYRALQAQYPFFTRVQTPELATQITVMPIDQIGPDAAIIFSDILVVLQALGVEVLMETGSGPSIPQPVRSAAAAKAIQSRPENIAKLSYVMEALTMTRMALNGRVPLIGFAGAPWTLFCYLIEGKGSKTFDTAKAFAFQEPESAQHLLSVITDLTIDYLNAQIQAGAQVVQVFDSWAGLLSPAQFEQWALPYLQAIVSNIQGAPVILFAKGSWYALSEMAQTGAAALGIDWTTSAAFARAAVGSFICLQGNFDPANLLAPIPEVILATREMLDSFGNDLYIANLGHGILPNVPPDHARAFVDTVKAWEGVV
jgi:uroporphyrinogen decarboxylase